MSLLSFLFGRKVEPEPDKMVGEDTPAAEHPGIVFSRPPPTLLRMVRQPLFDTEWFMPRGDGHTPMFQRPCGQTFFADNTKTKLETDTNLWISGQLPQPMQFDWYAWRTEFSPDVPLDLIANFRFCSRVQFRFGERIWFSFPLGFIPCQMLAGVEELRQAVSVLAVDDAVQFERAWARAKTVSMENHPKPEDLPKFDHEVYRTETSRKICMERNRPLRIRASEVFSVNVYTDWDCGLKLPEKLAMRLYFEGFLYRPV